MISCDNNDSFKENKYQNNEKGITNREAYNSESLQVFVSNHILISNEIISLLGNDFELLNSNIFSLPENINDANDLENYYQSCNVSDYKKLTSLIIELANNSENFYKSNEDFYLLDIEERKLLFEAELDKQINFQTSKVDTRTCREQYLIDTSRCTRNYYIGTGVAVVSGFVSFGWSTVIGYAGVQASMMACLYDAEVDYKDCLKK